MRNFTKTDQAIIAVVGILFLFGIAANSLAVDFEISYTAPVTYEDGSTLAPNEITGYRINWGFDQNPNEYFEIGPVTSHPLVVELPARIEPYTLNVSVQTKTQDAMSEPSAMVSKVFVVEGSKPSAPSQITIQVSCTQEGCNVMVIE